MSVFDTAIDAIFADPNLGEAATYTPPAGAPTSCTVTVRKPDTAGTLQTTGYQISPAAQDIALIAEVRRSEIASPVRGGTLTTGGRTYPVRDVDLHPCRLTWVLALDKPT